MYLLRKGNEHKNDRCMFLQEFSERKSNIFNMQFIDLVM